MVQKSPGDKIDYQQVYDDVKSGKITMEYAIKYYTKEKIEPLYIKPGTIDFNMYSELQKMEAGNYTNLTNNALFAAFSKFLGTRPSLGYMVFGTLEYPNNESAPKMKMQIYNALKSGKPFQEVVGLYAATEEEKKNGGVVMGSPTLPDEIYNALKTKKEGEYTDPILYNGNYYVFYIYSLRPYDISTPESKEFFSKEMMSSMYRDKVGNDLLEYIKTSSTYKSFPDFQTIKKSYSDFTNFKNDNAILYQYNNHQVSFADFKKDISSKINGLDKIPEDQWQNLINAKSNQDLLNFYSTDFVKQKDVAEDLETFKKNLYSEYIFSQYLQGEVAGHPEKLTEYYNQNKSKYVWANRAKGRVAILANDAVKSDVANLMKNPANWKALQAKYKGKSAGKNQELVHFEEGMMYEDADVFQKNGVPFKTGFYNTKINGSTVFIYIDQIVPSAQMTQEEAAESLKDAVTDNILQETIAAQKAKTNIVIQPGFVEDLEKDFKK
jgi:peptidyl-prolyl cis-trans isomerase SurA